MPERKMLLHIVLTQEHLYLAFHTFERSNMQLNLVSPHLESPCVLQSRTFRGRHKQTFQMPSTNYETVSITSRIKCFKSWYLLYVFTVFSVIAPSDATLMVSLTSERSKLSCCCCSSRSNSSSP